MCEAGAGRCSREVGIKVGGFGGVSMRFRASGEGGQGQVQVWVSCPGTDGGHVNTVWIDEIALS